MTTRRHTKYNNCKYQQCATYKGSFFHVSTLHAIRVLVKRIYLQLCGRSNNLFFATMLNGSKASSVVYEGRMLMIEAKGTVENILNTADVKID